MKTLVKYIAWCQSSDLEFESHVYSPSHLKCQIFFREQFLIFQYSTQFYGAGSLPSKKIVNQKQFFLTNDKKMSISQNIFLPQQSFIMFSKMAHITEEEERTNKARIFFCFFLSRKGKNLRPQIKMNPHLDRIGGFYF